MSLCINIATHELMIIPAECNNTPKQIVSEPWPIKIINTKYVIMSDDNIYKVSGDNLLLMTELETIANSISSYINIDVDNIKFSDIKIIQASGNIVLLKYDKFYYYYSDKNIHRIGQSADISEPIIVQNSNMVAFINKSDRNNLILYCTVSGLRRECDTEVNFIFCGDVVSKYIGLYYHKNTTLICKSLENPHDLHKLKLVDSIRQQINTSQYICAI